MNLQKSVAAEESESVSACGGVTSEATLHVQFRRSEWAVSVFLRSQCPASGRPCRFCPHVITVEAYGVGWCPPGLVPACGI